MDWETKWNKLKEEVREQIKFASDCCLEEEKNALKMVLNIMNKIEEESHA